jgi:flagellar hook-basal body complex protein FliE
LITNSMIPSVGLLPNVNQVQTKATPAEATESFASFLKSALDGVAAQERMYIKSTINF